MTARIAEARQAITNTEEGTGMEEGTVMNSDQLVTAHELEARGIIKKGTAYRMAAAGKLIHYKVGCAGGGIRFRVDEVLAVLRRPVSHEVR